MAMSEKILSSIKAKLDAMTNQQKKTSLIFRPPRGQEVQLRVVPYRHGPDPFNELFFHYDIGEVKTILCNASVGIGEKCPICDYARFILQGEKSDKNYALYKTLKSRMRVYVPVIIRGQEAEGVKFWGIGKTTYTTIGQFFIDPEYGDLSDPLKGRDLKILATASSPQHIYGQVQIRPSANTSAISPNTAQVTVLLQNIPNVFEAFTKMTTEEVQAALDKFIEQGDGSEEKPLSNLLNDDVDSGDADTIDDMFASITPKKTKE